MTIDILPQVDLQKCSCSLLHSSYNVKATQIISGCLGKLNVLYLLSELVPSNVDKVVTFEMKRTRRHIEMHRLPSTYHNCT